MALSALAISILTLFSFGTSIISAICGMGGGVVLLSLMTFFLPLAVVIPIHGMVQLISNSARCYLLRAHIHKKVLQFYALGLPLGAFIALWLIQNIDSKLLPQCLITGLILYSLFKPKRLPHLSIPFPAFFLVGVITGVLAPLIGAVGPFLAPFFLRDDFDKKTVVATKSILQTLAHLIKIPTFIGLGFHYQDYGFLIMAMTIMALFGTKIGVQLLNKVSDQFFKIIFKGALSIAAIRLLYKIGQQIQSGTF